MSYFLSRRLFIVLPLLLSGCGMFSSAPEGTWLSPEQQQANSKINHWQLSGKIGLRSETSANTGYLNWQQCAEKFDIRLTGPLGQGAAHLYGNNTQVSLQTQKTTQTAQNPEQLLQQHLGWSIPVSQLIHWIRGVPAPNQVIDDQYDNGFSQMGWSIHYSKWQTIQGHRIPKKATATHPQLKVTLILKNWQLNTDCSIDS